MEQTRVLVNVVVTKRRQANDTSTQVKAILNWPTACFFCEEGRIPDYKDRETLARFITDRGKIVVRVRSGVCAKHQRRLTKAIKRARHLAFLPYMVKPR